MLLHILRFQFPQGVGQISMATSYTAIPPDLSCAPTRGERAPGPEGPSQDAFGESHRSRQTLMGQIQTLKQQKQS